MKVNEWTLSKMAQHLEEKIVEKISEEASKFHWTSREAKRSLASIIFFCIVDSATSTGDRIM